MNQQLPPHAPSSEPLAAPAPTHHVRDTVFAWLSIPVCFFLVKALLATERALGATLATLLAIAFSLLYLRLSGVRLSARAYFTGTALALLSLGALTNSGKTLRTLLLLALIASLPFFIYTCCINRQEKLFYRFCARVSQATLQLPFNSVKSSLPCLFSKKNGKTSRIPSVLGWCALGLLIAVIPTLIIGVLLSYDAQFTSLLDRIFDFSLERILKNLRDVIFSVLLSVPLFGALFGNLQRAKREQRADGTLSPSISLRILPKPLLCAFVTPILLLYVLFFVSQWSYYVSAFTHVLPGELTYAEYAREGFFQLCAVCVINALILLVFQTMMRKNEGERELVRRIYTAIISVFTIVLIATALSKMVLYIDTYGMTLKRIYATWLILLLAAVFLLTVVSAVCRKFPLFPCIFAATVLALAILFLFDFGTTVANYNVTAYQNGDLITVDVASLEELGDAAVPALVRLEDILESKENISEDEAALLAQAGETLDRMQAEAEAAKTTVWDFTIPKMLANRSLRAR